MTVSLQATASVMAKGAPRKPRIIVFASGTETGGGSGFEKLIENKEKGILSADVVAVVSNWPNGGVKQRADKLGIPFEPFAKPYTLEAYRAFLSKYNAEWIILSGWLKLVPMANPDTGTDGLDPKTTINIHPGPLPRFGGKGMYGSNVHKAVWEALCKGEVTVSGPTMHFVTAEYDKGPSFFFKGVELESEETPETIQAKVNKIEHEYQAWAANLVVNGKIRWDGVNASSLIVPEDYVYLP